MLRYVYFGIFLWFCVMQGILTKIPSYQCDTEKLFDCILSVNLTKSRKDFKVIPTKNVTDIKSIGVDGKMEILTSDVCDTLPNIETFWANKIYLMSVEEKAFQKCWNMTFVLLYDNRLETLPLRVFSSNKNLKGVWLYRNKLMQIDMKLFSNNLNLEYLDLSKNQLTQVLSIPEMPVMNKLEEISLSNNQLSDVDVETILAKCPNLETFYLHRNTFECGRQQKINEILTVHNIKFDNLSTCIKTLSKYSMSGGVLDLSIEINSFSASNCGDVTRHKGYVHGGDRKDERSFPWVSAMYVRGKYACTANFISRKRAVTAAHCFERNPEAADIALLLFSNKYVFVNKYKQHPNFVEEPHFDIAILDTDEVDEHRFVPICLPGRIVSLVGHEGQVLSWAPSPENDYKALLSAELSVVRNQYCAEVFRDVPKHSFCVKHGHDGAWLCEGDSGAGFVVLAQNTGSTSRDRRYFLHGLVSTGLINLNGNCMIGTKVIFTDVTKFLSFVLSDV